MALLKGLILVLLALPSAAPPAPAAALAQETLEYELRATFIYNFTRFVDWPPDALPLEAFRICVAGDPRFARALDPIISGELVNGRPLLRVDAATPEAARTCQILYIGRQDPARGRRLLAAVRDLPILTVGDGALFLREGGAVRFLLEDDRVRFDVSLPAVDRARLRVSSRLLRVARRVEGAPS